MPTAVEHALKTPWQTQDGCGSGPPNSLLAGQEHALPDMDSGDWQVTGVFAAPLLLVAVAVAAVRRGWCSRAADATLVRGHRGRDSSREATECPQRLNTP